MTYSNGNKNNNKNRSRSQNKNRNRTYRSRSRTNRIQQEAPINFFKVKLVISVMLLMLIIALQQLNVKIGNMTSEKIYDMLYYNEDIKTFNDRYLDIDDLSIKTFWNNQK